MEIKVMKENERPYTYAQSQQISMQTGLIGHMRADMDTNGKGFFSSWEDFNTSLKTAEFKEEIDRVINAMRFDDVCGGILKDRSSLLKYCMAHPESNFHNDEFAFGFHVDGDAGYTYLFRMNPNKGVYNVYCYCYKKDMLDAHLENAENGIVFVDTDYNDLFKIPDGDKIRIIMSKVEKGKFVDKYCRYIDPCHVEVGGTLFHNFQFAELMQQNGYTIFPMRSSLPSRSYDVVDGDVVIIEHGADGYFKCGIPGIDQKTPTEVADEYNERLHVTKKQAAAMRAGSMFGWQVPAADPDNYDDNGVLKNV